MVFWKFRMDEAAKRVTGVLDEFQKKQDDFLLDLPIKAAGGNLNFSNLNITVTDPARFKN